MKPICPPKSFIIRCLILLAQEANVNGNREDLLNLNGSYLPLLYDWYPNHLIFQKFSNWNPQLSPNSLVAESLDALIDKFNLCNSEANIWQRAVLGERILKLSENHEGALDAVYRASSDGLKLARIELERNAVPGYSLFPSTPNEGDLKVLQFPGEFVNDAVVGYYLGMLQRGKIVSPSVMLLDPSFGTQVFQKASWGQGSYKDLNGSKWSQEWGQFILNKKPVVKNIIMAVHLPEGDDHFVAMRINLEESKVHFYDSLWSGNSGTRHTHLRAHQMTQFCSHVFKRNYQLVWEHVMQQATKTNDCSVFVCRFVHSLCQDPTNWASEFPENWKKMNSKGRTEWGLMQRHLIATLIKEDLEK